MRTVMEAVLGISKPLCPFMPTGKELVRSAIAALMCAVVTGSVCQY
jgi:hypothetical protein